MAFASAAMMPTTRLRGAEMAEQIKGVDLKMWIVVALTAVTLFVSLSDHIFGAGGFWGTNTATIASMQQQLSSLTDQVKSLAGEINSGPRLDQMQSLAHEMGQLDGRLDAYDQRLRQVETVTAAEAAKLQDLDAVSKSGQGGKLH